MTEEPATPPHTGGRAARFGFIRSEQDRTIAGVSTAFGRATGTDPLLWRVLLAVLTIFAGAGLVIYLVCWLVFPAEGDATSAAGALVSSKTSSTSKVIALLLALGAGLLGFVTIISTNGRPFLVFALVAALVIALTRRAAGLSPPTQPPSPDKTHTDAYQAPFAPGGPYANRTLDLPVEPPPPPPPAPPAAEPAAAAEPPPEPESLAKPPAPQPPPASPPAPQRIPPQRSALGLVTGCFVVIELGVAAIMAMLGVPVDAGTALSLALLLCGGGLLLGTWWGRGRGLILLGIVLAIALAGVSIFGDSPVPPLMNRHVSVDTQDSIPEDMSTVGGRLDLNVAAVDFSEADEHHVAVYIWKGIGTIVVPDDLDVRLNLESQRSRVVVDREMVDDSSDANCHGCLYPGADGKGGGTLVIDASVESGTLEIRR